MEKAKLMQLEIEKKRRLPKKIKDNISTNIFQDLIAALIIMTYLVSINIFYYKFESNTFEQYLKFFALVIIFITVIAFEIAYRKDSLKFTFIGIELLTCGILSLYIPYIYLHTTSTLRNAIMILPALLIIYYAFKAFIIFKQKQFEYQNNLSDVKEIIKDTNISYIEEESKKSFREKTKNEEEIRKKIIKQQSVRKALRQKEIESVTTTNNKKSNNVNKKENKNEISKSIEKEDKKIISDNTNVINGQDDTIKKVIIRNKKIRKPNEKIKN